MMLHRHFEKSGSENTTTSSDVSLKQPRNYVSEIFPPEADEDKPKRGRKKKED